MSIEENVASDLMLNVLRFFLGLRFLLFGLVWVTCSRVSTACNALRGFGRLDSIKAKWVSISSIRSHFFFLATPGF